jgi:hypothetical protein
MELNSCLKNKNLKVYNNERENSIRSLYKTIHIMLIVIVLSKVSNTMNIIRTFDSELINYLWYYYDKM